MTYIVFCGTLKLTQSSHPIYNKRSRSRGQRLRRDVTTAKMFEIPSPLIVRFWSNLVQSLYHAWHLMYCKRSVSKIMVTAWKRCLIARLLLRF